MARTKILNGVEVQCDADWDALRDAEEDAELKARPSTQMKWCRERRNQLLAECDWTQSVDVPEIIKNKWSTYRQTLRDLPQTVTDGLALYKSYRDKYRSDINIDDGKWPDIPKGDN